MQTLSETEGMDRQKYIPVIGGVLAAVAMGAGIWLAMARQPDSSTVQAADPPASVQHASANPLTVDLDSPQQWVKAPVEEPPVLIDSVVVDSPRSSRPRVRRAPRHMAALQEPQRPAPLDATDREAEVSEPKADENEVTSVKPAVEEPRVEPAIPVTTEPEVIRSAPEPRSSAPKRAEISTAPRPERKREAPRTPPRSAKNGRETRTSGDTMADWHRKFLEEP
jgi:hypothetical protein